MTKPIKQTTKQEEKIVTSPQTANENEAMTLDYMDDAEFNEALDYTVTRYKAVLEELAK